MIPLISIDWNGIRVAQPWRDSLFTQTTNITMELNFLYHIEGTKETAADAAPQVPETGI